MKKKKVFACKNKNLANHNQKVCEVKDEREEITENDSMNIDEKLTKLFNTNGYIFNIDVKIITNDKTYNTKIASQIGNSLITLDNDIILIDDIKDIIF